MPRVVKNMGASVRARLLKISKDGGQEFPLVLLRYANERLLYRLSESPHAERFVLKGAILLMAWEGAYARGTRDVDLTGHVNPDDVLGIFKEVFAQEVPDDGVVFDPESAKIDRIREDTEYGGLRIKANADIDGARIPVSIDVGFADVAVPEPEMLNLPGMLDLPGVKIRGYARETVIAEKFQAIVELSLANTRLKDYYDIWLLSQSANVDEDLLGQAIAATFERRKTEIPVDVPDGLTVLFSGDGNKQGQWDALVSELPTAPGSLEDVIGILADFLMSAAKIAIEIRDSEV